MTDQPNNKELFGIALDVATGEIDVFPVSEKPRDHRFGLFVSHRTGARESMELLKQNIIRNAFRTLKRVK